ncbi:PAS domain S-box protein [Chloroflexota bacterium]
MINTGNVIKLKDIKAELTLLRKSLDTCVEGIVITDLMGNIIDLNKAILQLHGIVRKEDMIGKDALDFIAPEDRVDVGTSMKKMAGKGYIENVVYCIVTVDGRKIPVEANGALITDEQGNPRGSVVIVRDISERKQAEESLQRSEKYYRSLLENAMEAVAVVNRDGTIRYTSLSKEPIVGRDSTDQMGKSIFEHIHPDDLPNIAKNFEELLHNSGGTVRMDVRILHVDGTYRTLEVIAKNLLDDPVVDGIVANFRDITERQLSEEAIKEAERRYKAIFDNRLQMVYVINEMGVFLDANDCALERLGYTRDDLGKISMIDVLHPDDLTKALESESKIQAAGYQEHPLEFRLITKSGEIIYVVVFGIPLEQVDGHGSAICIANDITESKRVEQALRLKENAIENSISAIAMSDMEGKITYVNKAGMRLWGNGSREDLLGKGYWELLESTEVVSEKPIKQMEEIKGTVLEDHAWDGELVGVNKDGKKIHLNVIANIVKDDNGNPIQTISSFTDISERKRAEADKLRMEQQLQLAGRLAAVGELAAGVAHELNNPLAAIQAFAQFLSSREDLDTSIKNDVGTIYKESLRAAKITENLLCFARKHNVEKSLTSINEIVCKSVEMHAYRMKVNNIELVTELALDIPMTMADSNQIQQVFINIITNAEQVMTEMHSKGRLLIKTTKIGDRIRIRFTDDGPGIPEDCLKSVFDPFFTTKEVGKGTGLGLSICYGIVQEHSGKIYAESTLGQGSTFTVELPILSENQVIYP